MENYIATAEVVGDKIMLSLQINGNRYSICAPSACDAAQIEMAIGAAFHHGKKTAFTEIVDAVSKSVNESIFSAKERLFR